MNVDVRAVTRRHRNGRGVGPVDVHLADGECVALMGPNGAGKTTLLRIVATADAAHSGDVLWYRHASLRRARQWIGYAPDTIVEEGTLTARQATHFWCSQWTPRENVEARVTDALRRFGLGDVADERVAGFSFGMRRRLGLAQAVAHEPPLLLLDEPTAGLDPEGVDALSSVLRDRAGRACTTLIASNDCAFVAATCDRVIFLDDGRVLRDAAPSTLLGEVGAGRRADLELGGVVDTRLLRGIAGVGAVERVDGVVSVELLDDAALIAVVAAADAPAGTLRAVRLHAPDLGDSFRHLTGRDLVPEREAR